MAYPLFPAAIGPITAGGGAWMQVYEAGTTKPVSLYANSNETVALTNPVQADAYGTFPQAFVEAGVYRYVIYPDGGSTSAPTYDHTLTVAAGGGSSGVNVDLVGGVFHGLITGQSNAHQARISAVTPDVPDNQVIWDRSSAEYVALVKGAGDLPDDNGQHMIFPMATAFSPYYEECRWSTSWQGGRPVSDWAGVPKTRGTQTIALGTTGKTLTSLLTDSALFGDNDTLTLKTAAGVTLTDDADANITFDIDDEATILDLIDWLNKSEKIERRIDGKGLAAGFDAYAQTIVLESGQLTKGTVDADEGHQITNNQSGGGTFASATVSPTAANRDKTTGNRPRYADIIAQADAAAVPRFNVIFIVQGEADAETPIYPYAQEGSFAYEWALVIRDLIADGKADENTRIIFTKVYEGRHRSQQWVQNVSIEQIYRQVNNCLIVPTADLEAEDEGTVDGAGIPYRIHFEPDACEEIGKRNATAYMSSVGLAGYTSDTSGTFRNETATARGIPGALGGPAVTVTNGHAFLRKADLAGVTIRPSGIASITILDGEFHPSKDEDGGRGFKINSESTTQTAYIYSVGHQIRDRVEAANSEFITVVGAGFGELEMVNNKWLQNAWTFGGTAPASTAFSWWADANGYVNWNGRTTVTNTVASTKAVTFPSGFPTISTSYGTGFHVVGDYTALNEAIAPTTSGFNLIRHTLDATAAGGASAVTRFVGRAKIV